MDCGCERRHPGKRVVITGGPGAGKTAVLELAQRTFCAHVALVPEAASILFGGGFPRHANDRGIRAAQRAIFHVQRELEWLGEASNAALQLCDRGTLDGLAYWPGPEDGFWRDVGCEREGELARYDAVLHLRTPTAAEGYGRGNPVRTENAEQARALDLRIEQAWRGHPRRMVVASSPDFLAKAHQALALIAAELPECCARRGGAPGR